MLEPCTGNIGTERQNTQRHRNRHRNKYSPISPPSSFSHLPLSHTQTHTHIDIDTNTAAIPYLIPQTHTSWQQAMQVKDRMKGHITSRLGSTGSEHHMCKCVSVCIKHMLSVTLYSQDRKAYEFSFVVIKPNRTYTRLIKSSPIFAFVVVFPPNVKLAFWLSVCIQTEKKALGGMQFWEEYSL